MTHNLTYDFTGREKKHMGRTLYQIQARVDLDEIFVKAGDPGGWIEHEGNLDSVIGTKNPAWIYSHAMVFGDAIITGHATVDNKAEVYGNAIVRGRAYVGRRARVTSHTIVEGQARVIGSAHVMDNSHIYGNIVIGSNDLILGESDIADRNHVLIIKLNNPALPIVTLTRTQDGGYQILDSKGHFFDSVKDLYNECLLRICKFLEYGRITEDVANLLALELEEARRLIETRARLWKKEEEQANA